MPQLTDFLDVSFFIYKNNLIYLRESEYDKTNYY